MKPSEQLKSVKALIEDPKHFTQGKLARDAEDNRVAANAPTACKWCIEGALYKIGGHGQAWTYILRVSDSRYLAPHQINDLQGHEAVLDLCDEAIELAEEKEADENA